MSHRTLPNRAELLGVMRHLADVTALKGDPTQQRQLLIDGLNDLFGTTLGWLAGLDDWRIDRRPRPVLAVLASKLDPVWHRYVADFGTRVAPADDPYGDHSLRSDEADQVWGRHRVMPDRAAHRRYAAAVEIADSVGLGDGTVALARTGPGGHRVIGFSLHRCDGEVRFRPRDFALHRVALVEIRRLVERGHVPIEAVAGHDGRAGLPPRLRQVLAALLAGTAPKRIARDLGLSVWTVRDHVKRLYAHFGVSGRDELMARFLSGDGSGGGSGDGSGDRPPGP